MLIALPLRRSVVDSAGPECAIIQTNFANRG